jgi:hypothetical protein
MLQGGKRKRKERFLGYWQTIRIYRVISVKKRYALENEGSDSN